MAVESVVLDHHNLTSADSILVENAFKAVFSTPIDVLAAAAVSNEKLLGVELDLERGYFYMERATLEGIVEDAIDTYPCYFSAQYFVAHNRNKFPEIAIIDKVSKKTICTYCPLFGLKWLSRFSSPKFRKTDSGELMGMTFWHPGAYIAARGKGEIDNGREKSIFKLSSSKLPGYDESESKQADGRKVASKSSFNEATESLLRKHAQERAEFLLKFSSLRNQFDRLRDENLRLGQELELAQARSIDLQRKLAQEVEPGADTVVSKEDSVQNRSLNVRPFQITQTKKEPLDTGLSDSGYSGYLPLMWSNLPDFYPVSYSSDVVRRLSLCSARFRLCKPPEWVKVSVRFEILKEGTPSNFCFQQGIEPDLEKRCILFIKSAGPFRPLLSNRLDKVLIELEIEQPASEPLKIVDIHIEALGNRL
ncbi:MAG: hypothetical protein K2Y32_06100 [Candidatus Obscuribacterales bacterium]|nr:hypothetical protein [Candidatus Obscuribacterales bacterium]